MSIRQKPDVSDFCNQLIVGNCLQEMDRLPANSIDLIFAECRFLTVGSQMHSAIK